MFRLFRVIFRVCVCMGVCVCIYIYTHTHTYIHMCRKRRDLFYINYKFTNNRHQVGSKKPKQLAETLKFTKCLMKICVRVHFIVLFN